MRSPVDQFKREASDRFTVEALTARFPLYTPQGALRHYDTNPTEWLSALGRYYEQHEKGPR